jgi:hypothetical protein
MANLNQRQFRNTNGGFGSRFLFIYETASEIGQILINYITQRVGYLPRRIDHSHSYRMLNISHVNNCTPDRNHLRY